MIVMKYQQTRCSHSGEQIDRSITKQIDALLSHAWLTYREDNTAALQVSQTCLQQSIDLGYEYGRACSLRNLSRCHLDRNETELALEYAQESVALFEVLRDIEGLTQIVNLMGEAHWELGDYSQAQRHNMRVLQLAQASGLQQMEAHALTNLAQIYVRLGQFDKVREMLTQAMPIFAEIEDQSGLFHALNNMAMLSLTEKRYDSAETYARRALTIAKSNQWRVYTITILDTLGQILSAVGRTDEAEQAFYHSLRVNGGEHKRKACVTHQSLAQLYLVQHKYDSVVDSGLTALAIGESLDNRQLQYDAHRLIAEAYEAAGDVHNALAHLKKYHALYQEEHSEQKERALVNMEVRYRTTAARKEAQILRQTNADLQYEIAERMRVEAELVEAKNSAERAKWAAEAASRAKSEFLSNMSHELRTPLNGILGYAQILARSQGLRTAQLEGVKIIQHSGEHLLTLINDILDISKIEARRLELQNGELHLEGFLEGIVGLMKMRAEQQGIELIFETCGVLPKGILVDEKRLRQVLINLVGNAIKFTERGHVKLHVCSRLNGVDEVSLQFEVEDTGIGIEAQYLEEIFQPFEQVGNSQQRAAGTGLGLAISQRLIEAMGGEISVESQLGVGSRFWFNIVVPTAMAHLKPRALSPSIIGYHGPPLSMLIVDDTSYNRLLLRSLLAPLGFELFEASNGEEALALSAEHKPDMIFLDLILPDRNGLDLVADLRRNAPHTTILAVSASLIDLSKEWVVNAGCDDFLPKPIVVDDLFALIHNFLDIVWIYEARDADQQIIEPFDVTVDALPTMPQLDTLRELALIGDLHGIEQVALELQQEFSELNPFTYQLIQFARDFEEEALTNLLQTCFEHMAQHARPLMASVY